MRIAALIQAHARPDLVSCLVARLATPLWRPYIHVDAQVDAATFAPIAHRARWVPERIRVHWGAFSQVRASLALLRAAIGERDVTHFYLMSGQCCPIKSDDQIAALLETHRGGANFISVAPMPGDGHKSLSRFTRRHYNDMGSRWFRVLANRSARFLPPRSVPTLLHGLPPHAGSSWWLLERETVEHMLRFIDSNPWYGRAFAHALGPEESFFQTLVPALAVPVAGPCPTATRWVEGTPHPLTVNAELLAELRSGWHLCARKFDSPALMTDAAAAP